MSEPLLLALIGALSPILIALIQGLTSLLIQRKSASKVEEGGILVPMPIEGRWKRHKPRRRFAVQWYLGIGLGLAVIGYGIGIVRQNGSLEDQEIKVDFIDTQGSLNPDLRWDAGSSELSTYIPYSEDTLELVAGQYTWPLFPTLIYRYSVQGDFSVQLEIDFTSAKPALPTAAQMAGILIRPVNDQLVLTDERFPDDWVVNRKSIADTGHGIGCRGSTTDYDASVAYLRIDKSGQTWRCAYSKNHQNWIWSEPKVDVSLIQSPAVEIVLFAYSSNEETVTAKFRNWMILQNR
jgi:hypothetical protein